MHTPSLGPLVERSNGDRLLRHLLDSHTGATEVGKIASRAGVGMLVLSHLVPGDDSVPDDEWRIRAAQDFDGPVILGEDLMQL